jgi:hypothetical protein
MVKKGAFEAGPVHIASRVILGLDQRITMGMGTHVIPAKAGISVWFR